MDHQINDNSNDTPAAKVPEKNDDDSNKNNGVKRSIIDESQLNEEDARKLVARRAYNRKCAAKARKRSKDLIVSLQAQVQQLTAEKSALERSSEVMRAKLELLEQQNRVLMMNQQPVMHGQMAQVGHPAFLQQTMNSTGYAANIPLQNSLQPQPGSLQSQQQGSLQGSLQGGLQGQPANLQGQRAPPKGGQNLQGLQPPSTVSNNILDPNRVFLG